MPLSQCKVLGLSGSTQEIVICMCSGLHNVETNLEAGKLFLTNVVGE